MGGGKAPSKGDQGGVKPSHRLTRSPSLLSIGKEKIKILCSVINCKFTNELPNKNGENIYTVASHIWESQGTWTMVNFLLPEDTNRAVTHTWISGMAVPCVADGHFQDWQLWQVLGFNAGQHFNLQISLIASLWKMQFLNKYFFFFMCILASGNLLHACETSICQETL